MDLEAIQAAITEAGFDGWLFYDFHKRDVTAYRILGLDESRHAMRRWYYWVPASGEPVRLVHGVEATALDGVPGEKIVYVTWQRMHEALGEILSDAARIAMQYSPDCDIPYVSLIDAGTVELIRRVGNVDVVSSADLVARFEATFGPEGVASHDRAMEIVHRIKDEAYARVAAAIRSDKTLTEYELARFIVDRFTEEGLDCGQDTPIVGVDAHPADPHFEPTEQNSVAFAEGQTVLVDLWAREAGPEGIYADITWCGYIGETPAEEYLTIWKAVTDARDAAAAFVIKKALKGDEVQGWEVDQVSRDVITAAGYGEYFIHRTGHSIGHEVHGNGANIDNFETRDSRSILPGTCFSIEPGIYLADRMAVRTEINMLILPDGKARISGPVQKDLIRIP